MKKGFTWNWYGWVWCHSWDCLIRVCVQRHLLIAATILIVFAHRFIDNQIMVCAIQKFGLPWTVFVAFSLFFHHVYQLSTCAKSIMSSKCESTNIKRKLSDLNTWREEVNSLSNAWAQISNGKEVNDNSHRKLNV